MFTTSSPSTKFIIFDKEGTLPFKGHIAVIINLLLLLLRKIDLCLPRSLKGRQGIELLMIKFSSFPVYNFNTDRYKYPLHCLPQICLIILNNLFDRQILSETNKKDEKYKES